MKKNYVLIVLFFTSYLFAGELTGFGGLAFRSSKLEAEKFIQEKNGTITKNIDSKTKWEEYNQEVRAYNEDYELNKTKKKYKDKKPKIEHSITAYEEKESILEGTINYAGYTWNFIMKFYDDEFYKVDLEMRIDNKSVFKTYVSDLNSKIKQINTKYGLTVDKDADITKQEITSKMYRVSINYKSFDDKYSFFEAQFKQENTIYFYEIYTMKFYSYFKEVDEALGITDKKIEEFKKALQEYSEL